MTAKLKAELSVLVKMARHMNWVGVKDSNRFGRRDATTRWAFGFARGVLCAAKEMAKQDPAREKRVLNRILKRPDGRTPKKV